MPPKSNQTNYSKKTAPVPVLPIPKKGKIPSKTSPVSLKDSMARRLVK